MVTCCLEKPILRYKRMKWAVTGAPRECWEEVPRIPRNQVRVTQKKCSKRNKEIIVTISILEGTYVPGKAHRSWNLRHSFCHKIMRTENSCGLWPGKDWEYGSNNSEKRRGWESGSDSGKSLSCKLENLCWIPRTCMKSWGWWHALVISGLGRRTSGATGQPVQLN